MIRYGWIPVVLFGCVSCGGGNGAGPGDVGTCMMTLTGDAASGFGTRHYAGRNISSVIRGATASAGSAATIGCEYDEPPVPGKIETIIQAELDLGSLDRISAPLSVSNMMPTFRLSNLSYQSDTGDYFCLNQAGQGGSVIGTFAFDIREASPVKTMNTSVGTVTTYYIKGTAHGVCPGHGSTNPGNITFDVVFNGGTPSGEVGGTAGLGGGGGGQLGSGGSTGRDGGIGDGSQDGSSTGCDPNLPACVADLFNACTPSGSCVEQTDMMTDKNTTNDCYSNGVKTVSTSTVVSSNMFTATIRFVKPDGSTCFSDNFNFDGSGNGTSTLTNASGATVATGTFDTNGSTLTCGGRTYNLCKDSGTENKCTMGTCQ
jgi:hypothetical protein